MKAPDAFRTISEVAEDLDLPQHVLRFWETRFSQIKPMKRGGGRRYYRPEDIDLLRGIRGLLYAEGFTIRGVQRLLKEKGVAFVADLGRSGSGGREAPSKPEPALVESDWQPDPAADDESDFGSDAPVAPEQHHSQDLRTDPGFAPAAETEVRIEADRPANLAPAAPSDAAKPAVLGERLSPGERRRIEFALADLLEAKRLLDQVR